MSSLSSKQAHTLTAIALIQGQTRESSSGAVERVRYYHRRPRLDVRAICTLSGNYSLVGSRGKGGRTGRTRNFGRNFREGATHLKITKSSHNSYQFA